MGGAARVPATAAAAAAPTHTLSVSGPDVSMAPAYDPAIRRYALRTGPASNGTVTVSASTSDPAGQVRVNGRPVTGGTVTLTGVEAGDEISVIVDDSSGSAAHSLIYLPAAFPDLEGSGPVPGLAPGDLLLTLNDWSTSPDRFHTVVDDYGVPKWFRREPTASHDLRLQENGRFSQAVRTTTAGREGVAIVEMNARFEEIARHETVGLVNTDFHDSLLRADGSEVLIAYELSANQLAIDAVIQEINPDGSVFVTWNSGDHVDRNAETVVDLDNPLARFDYAHINSVTMTPDGDYLASFRGLSAVFKIARTAHDGYAQGEVIWRLGGRLSDFTFPNDEYGGPCAQHTATMLPNGHVVIFDNGSDDLSGHAFCVDPEDRSGPTVPREFSRYVEYALDEDAMTATLVGEYDNDHYAPFTGSAFRLDNGNTLVGWGAAPTAIASELDPAGQLLWQLETPTGQGSYRVYRERVPDAFAPEVDLTSPADGATYSVGATVRADYGCTDRGGSDLVTCSAAATSGALLDTSTPGTRTLEVTAVDGDGNRTVRRHTYVVGVPSTPPVPVGPARPDLLVRSPDGSFVGAGRFLPVVQRVRHDLPLDGRVTTKVRLRNAGASPGRFTLTAPKVSGLSGHFFLGDREVTRRITGDGVRTRVLGPGQRLTLRLVVRPTGRTAAGDRRTFRVTATSVGVTPGADRVAAVVRARAE